jgi:hypothetical protein
MQPLPRPSVSPLYSFCSIPTRRSPPFTESLKAIWSWLRGKPPSFRESVRQANLIERLAEEMRQAEEAEAETKPHGRTG